MQPRYEAIRRHARERWRPYQGEQRTVNTLDDPEEEEAEDQDLRVYDEERNVLIREAQCGKEREVHSKQHKERMSSSNQLTGARKRRYINTLEITK